MFELPHALVSQSLQVLVQGTTTPNVTRRLKPLQSHVTTFKEASGLTLVYYCRQAVVMSAQAPGNPLYRQYDKNVEALHGKKALAEDPDASRKY